MEMNNLRVIKYQTKPITTTSKSFDLQYKGKARFEKGNGFKTSFGTTALLLMSLILPSSGIALASDHGRHTAVPKAASCDEMENKYSDRSSQVQQRDFNRPKKRSPIYSAPFSPATNEFVQSRELIESQTDILEVYNSDLLGGTHVYMFDGLQEIAQYSDLPEWIFAALDEWLADKRGQEDLHILPEDFSLNSHVSYEMARTTMYWAVKAGVLLTNYDIYCPQCSNMVGTVNRQMDIPHRSSCTVCHTEFDPWDHQERIAVTFSIKPNLLNSLKGDDA